MFGEQYPALAQGAATARVVVDGAAGAGVADVVDGVTTGVGVAALVGATGAGTAADVVGACTITAMLPKLQALGPWELPNVL